MAAGTAFTIHIFYTLCLGILLLDWSVSFSIPKPGRPRPGRLIRTSTLDFSALNLAATANDNDADSSSTLPPLQATDDFETKEFEKLSNIDTVIQALRAQIPTLLTTPLSEESSKVVYDEDIQLVVEDIVLASSREELVSLSTTLVLAVAATNQANSFFSSASVFGRVAAAAAGEIPSEDEPSSSAPSTLNSQMAIDPSLQAIRVQWQVNLPGSTRPSTTGQSQPTSNNNNNNNNNKRQLQGVSELMLDSDTGKVTTLRLLQVQWNGERMLNARAIGESLASLRQLVLAFQDSPVLKSLMPSLSPVSSFSSLLGPDFLQAFSSSSPSTSTTSERPDLFVTEQLDNAFLSITKKFNGTTSATRPNTTPPTPKKATINATAVDMTPIRDYTGNASQTRLPLPGSNRWIRLAKARRLYQSFLDDALPLLAGITTVPSREILELFSSSQVNLLAVDGSELLRGRDQVGNFFHTVASWRKRSSGTWELVPNATRLVHWDDNELTVTIAVGYRSTTKVPGSASVVTMEGIDHFIFERQPAPTDDINEHSESDAHVLDVVINRIEQKKLDIGGVGNRSPGGLWFMKSLVSALDTGRFSSVGGDSVVMDLLQRVIAGDFTLSPSGDVKTLSGKRLRRAPPNLSESVAARVYNIMAKLYEEVPVLLDRESKQMFISPPLSDFMSDNIELRGYLGETLARGSSPYNRAVGASFASLKAAQATGGVKMEQGPSVTVALTEEGNVRLSLTVYLKVLPLPSGTSDLISTISGKAISLPSGGFPLDIAIVSDYVIEKETGDIYQHKLVESRVNGQLTPGDVLSKWIQNQVSMTSKGPNDAVNAAALQRSLLDTTSWVRSMNRG